MPGHCPEVKQASGRQGLINMLSGTETFHCWQSGYVHAGTGMMWWGAVKKMIFWTRLELIYLRIPSQFVGTCFFCDLGSALPNAYR